MEGGEGACWRSAFAAASGGGEAPKFDDATDQYAASEVMWLPPMPRCDDPSRGGGETGS